MTWMVFGNLILITINWYNYISLFSTSFCFNEKINLYINHSRPFLDHIPNTSKFAEILCCMLYFQLSSQRLEM